MSTDRNYISPRSVSGSATESGGHYDPEAERIHADIAQCLRKSVDDKSFSPLQQKYPGIARSLRKIGITPTKILSIERFYHTEWLNPATGEPQRVHGRPDFIALGKDNVLYVVDWKTTTQESTKGAQSEIYAYIAGKVFRPELLSVVTIMPNGDLSVVIPPQKPPSVPYQMQRKTTTYSR